MNILLFGRAERGGLSCAPRGPCLDNSACKLNDPTILGDRRVFRHGLADLNSIIKGTWAQLLPYASQPADHLAPPSG